jgi:glutamine phosphoribosylpyrophosphate amidotransferase
MCEQYVARADEPFRIDDLWPFTDRLERNGIASYGWGATWLAGDGELHSYRDVGTFVDDGAGREKVGAETTRALLVHLRRPSKLSTIGPADTQPFDDPAGRYAFSHNGELRHEQRFRKRFRDAGRLLGRADTEVGARWLEDEWNGGTDVPEVLLRLHRAFEGDANLAVLTRDGRGYHYAGNSQNPVFSFDLGQIRLISTGIHSLDRSFFRYVAPDATNRRLVPRGTTRLVA